MTTTEAIKQLQTEHDLIATEHDLDGSQFAPALLEALAMAIEALNHSEIPNSSDCIDRAEAQTAIQFAARRYTVAHEAHGEGHVVWSDNLISVTDAMNALREVPSAQPEQRWIPCSERLPEVHESGNSFSGIYMQSIPVLVYGICEGEENAQFHVVTYCDDLDGNTYWATELDAFTITKVTAWMPLPEPYRAERRTDEGSDK